MKQYLPAIVALVYAIGMLLPFAVIGETYGMIWYPLSLPLSEWLESALRDRGVPLYCFTVTSLNAVILFLLIMGIRSTNRWLKREPNQNL